MASFTARYQRGEREQVWTELRRLQATVRNERYFEDALAVALETMQRARRNVETLIERLNEGGYEFEEALSLPLSPPEKHPGLLKHIEHDFWTLGLSARAWIEVVGEVNLSGTHPDWQDVNLTGNALVIMFDDRTEFMGNMSQTYESSAELFIESESIDVKLSEEIIQVDSFDEMPQQIRRIYVGRDLWYQCLDGVGWTVRRHEVLVPDRSADATIDLETSRTFFVDYLRSIFKWGGFPNFQHFGYQPHDEPIRTLAKDLLPI